MILFSRITGIGRGHRLCVHYYKIFEDIIFVDHTLSAKTAKFTSLENLYEYGSVSYQLKSNPILNFLAVIRRMHNGFNIMSIICNIMY